MRLHIFELYRSYKKRTGKMRPFIEAIRPLIPFVSLFIITTVWILFSRNDVLSIEPRMMFLLFGTVFSNISVSFFKQCVERFLRAVKWPKWAIEWQKWVADFFYLGHRFFNFEPKKMTKMAISPLSLRMAWNTRPCTAIQTKEKLSTNEFEQRGRCQWGGNTPGAVTTPAAQILLFRFCQTLIFR